MILYLLKAVGGLLVADAYNYWKHRLFHTYAKDEEEKDDDDDEQQGER